MLSNKPTPICNLKFLESTIGKSPQGWDVDMPKEDIKDMGERWKSALVGFFVGKKPNYHSIKFNLSRAWNLDVLEVDRMQNGFFLFKFKFFEEEARELWKKDLGLLKAIL